MKRKVWEGIRLENLQSVADEIVVWLQGAPPLWCFEGQMGAGKTTLITSLCRSLGVQDRVQSPTFSLVNEYLTREGELIYHFDFYRIEGPEEASRIGADEYFDSGTICLIEWPERIAPLLPHETVQLRIIPQPDTSRTVDVSIHGTTQ
ncbi:tRNA (adenosine(37)-N6)-threonylcarbamoyltransferase complex ATPase subunit type 1 TsaE [Cesiribacter andamanensis]|uniref:tRNA threonylcarbamoyladenosine biosynthesis protein TsaE n=1 Tax=Cesiribacter andamanensis AMV16 TaxID=1279009 RepID=M7N0A1_9BACT|nr:tRNA (adenosine(37)-N6)-threonylcarbamoyltransferase complex ATPase subunit type 1 TsaE [Cesiribacter andamanensis]EMR00651.1 hypothetical protein ADICEAN_04229 [Cesiribacter andamanensis AMV16]